MLVSPPALVTCFEYVCVLEESVERNGLTNVV